MSREWFGIAIAPVDEVVETKIDDENGERNHALLKRQGRLWFMPDGSMYVYYTPTHWRRPTSEQVENLAREAERKGKEFWKLADTLRATHTSGKLGTE